MLLGAVWGCGLVVLSLGLVRRGWAARWRAIGLRLTSAAAQAACSALWPADVAALAGAVAVGEQAEQALDPRAGAAQVLGGGRVVERLAGGDQQLLVGRDADLAASARGRDATLAQRAARRRPGLGEARPAVAGGLGADRRDLAGRAGHRADVEVDVEVALGQAAFVGRRLGHRGQHLDRALGELGADRSGAVGGVAEQALAGAAVGAGRRSAAWPAGRPARWRRRDLDRGDQRLARVGRRAESL